MTKLLKSAVALLCAIAIPCLMIPVMGSAQATTGAGGYYRFGTVTATGQLGSYLSYLNYPAAPAAHTFDWNFTGTTPAACTFQVEGSLGGTNWYALTAVTDCTTSGMLHIANKPVVLIRVNVISYTAGDGTTMVRFAYARGQ